MVIIFLAKNGDILIVWDWRGGGEMKREEVKFPRCPLGGSRIGVWDVTALSVCLYVSTLAPGLSYNIL